MSTQRVEFPLSQLPNALTVARLGVIPVFVVLVLRGEDGHSLAAGILFGVCAFTDQIDGWLARRWRVESTFGKFADPLADRLMINAGVVLLAIEGRLPWFAVAIVIARDLLLILGSNFAIRSGYEFSVNALGQAATWVLYSSVVAVLVTREGTLFPIVLFYVGVGLSLAAAIGYLFAVRRAVR
jgi:CDP-diacylglycerol--glycerol-3-phosphate 3-phosphatidyltransferase